MNNIILFILLVTSPATSFHHPLPAKRSPRRRHFGYPTSQSQSSLLSSVDDSDSISSSNQSNNDDRPTIIFPGGGLFFYWQAGVVVSMWRYRLCIAMKYMRAILNLLCYYCNMNNKPQHTLGISTRKQLQSIIEQYTTMRSISRGPISNTSQNECQSLWSYRTCITNVRW